MKQNSELQQRNTSAILNWPESNFGSRRGTVGVNLKKIKIAPLNMPGGSAGTSFRKQYLTTLEKEGKVLLPGKLKDYYALSKNQKETKEKMLFKKR